MTHFFLSVKNKPWICFCFRHKELHSLPLLWTQMWWCQTKDSWHVPLLSERGRWVSLNYINTWNAWRHHELSCLLSAMKCYIDTYGLQRMNPCEFGCDLTFPPEPPAGWHWFWVKCLYKCWLEYHESWFKQSCRSFIMNSNNFGDSLTFHIAPSWGQMSNVSCGLMLNYDVPISCTSCYVSMLTH